MMEVVFTYQKKGQENKVLTKSYFTDIDDYWELVGILEFYKYSVDLININSIDNIYNTSGKFTLEMGVQVASEDYFVGICSAMCELENLGFDTSVYIGLAKIEELFEDGCFIRDLQYKVLGIYDIMQQAYDIVWED